MSAPEDCKSLHPSSILGQASNNLKGKQLPAADPSWNEPGADGAVRDEHPRPNPEVGSPRVRGQRFKAEVRCVYFIRANTLGLVKIGVTNDAYARFLSLQSASPDELEFLGLIRLADAEALERRLHVLYRKRRVRGEWFRPTQHMLKFIAKAACSFDQDRLNVVAAVVAKLKAA